MNITHPPSRLFLAIAAGAVLIVGCDQHPAGPTAASVDRAAEKVGATVSNAANEAVAVADDAAITARVKAAILAEPGLKSLQINVDTISAMVTLTGSVDNNDLRERAKQITSSTAGVKGVVDHLTVKAS